MFSNNDQLSNAAKANMDAQIAAITEMTNKAFSSIAQLVELNVNAAKASLEQSTATAQRRSAPVISLIQRLHRRQRHRRIQL